MPTRILGSRRFERGVLLFLAGMVVAGAIGLLAGHSPRLGVAAALAVLALGVYAVDPLLLAVIVLPGAFLLQRVGGASTSLSVADVLVLLGTVAALPQVTWARSPQLKRFLGAIVAYEAILFIVLVAHPNRYDTVEWFHRLFDLIGATVIGSTLVASGRMQQALRLFLAGAGMVALLAIEHAFALHFAPAQWGLYQKNAIGEMMWPTIAILQLRPSWMRLEGRLPTVVKYLCVGGLLSSQSRQSIVVLIVAMGLAFALRPEIRRRSKAAILGGAGLGVLLYYSFHRQLTHEFKFSSIEIRLVQLRAAMHVWRHSLITGQGLGFYFLHRFISVTTPPNIVVDALASSGLVGLVALLFLVVGTLRVLARLPREFGIVGFVILAGHFLQGMFDIFWVGAGLVVPFVVAGMCLAMADAKHRPTVHTVAVPTHDRQVARQY